ncbi:hypothetical protein, partial [Scytonema sp. UIC 10036]|uniref:VMAP-C domain-containing protein n=1 Tax=Scytonema sp. UIC 10036 TaxID=2304196 RepID=UPI00140FD5AB
EKYSADDFITEIYLPYQHLYENIDDWNITDDINEPVALLQDFKVILHSIDRITGQNNYKNLREGWTMFKDILARQPIQEIIYESIETVRKNKNIDWKDLTKKLKKKIGIKFTKPIDSNTEKENFVLTVLRGGIPFAFWIKCQPSRSRKLEQIDCYLTLAHLENNLQRLVEEICHLRREAYRETGRSKPLGCYLGFWCDDPEKIQKLKQLKI